MKNAYICAKEYIINVHSMLVKVHTAAMQGLQAIPVVAEVNSSRGFAFNLVGLPDNAVKESHQRIVAAIHNSGYRFPTKAITVNLTPADLKKEGSSYDLPIAIGVMATEGELSIEHLPRFLMVGELSLDGTLLPVRGALPIAIMARKQGYEGLIVPWQNVREAAVVNRLKVYGARCIQEVVYLLNGSDSAIQVDTRKEFYERQYQYDIDFSDVRGQESVKRALEVAAAGSHNLIMIGPPGSGKSMMAKRLPTILPPLSLSESLETTQIHSVAGKLSRDTSLIATRPFRSPHHTISPVALVGGGNNPQPGEISLAHKGVLFLDELPEYSRALLETLRQPLEDKQIVISRAGGKNIYPADFMLIATMNPALADILAIKPMNVNEQKPKSKTTAENYPGHCSIASI